MILTTSPEANVNYTAKAVKLTSVVKHPNADRLQIATVDFCPVIVGENARVGDEYVFFVVESQLSKELVSFVNGFRHKEANRDITQVGFFEENCRIRAVKLRGERSVGFLVPMQYFKDFAESISGEKVQVEIGTTFDSIGEHVFVKKFVPYMKPIRDNRFGKVPRISRLVEGQVHLHVDTENLRRNADKITPEDYITISYKTHGTSWWVANVLTKRKLTLKDKVARWFGAAISEDIYDLVYGSRKVVKNEYESQNINNYYDADIWQEIKNEIGSLVPKGYTFYGEALGYVSSGKPIQDKYDYGCAVGKRRLQVYRITVTNSDGVVRELTSKQTADICTRLGLEYVTIFYSGKAVDLYPELDRENHWNESFVKALEKQYTEKDCFMCKNAVPEEGIVVRKEDTFNFEAYKLKSFRFLDLETAQMDTGAVDMETANQETV